jgi:pyruvate/2-oxoglutarate dehydrogenase complex dihydrolipoamide dehydrogenase (E3) component
MNQLFSIEPGMPDEYDLIVVGSGEGGKYLAWTMAREGKRAVVIERRYIGGSCPNIACLPSKNIIHSAKVAAFVSRSEEFGISKDNVKISMIRVRERKRAMVNGLIEMHLDNFKGSGAELLMGSASFIAPRTLKVTQPDGTSRVVRGTRVVIGTGSRATLPDISGLVASEPLTHVEALELDHIPEHLLVLGAGYVGLELAQAMRRLGSRVTVIDHNCELLIHEDEDVRSALEDLFKDEGIELRLGTRVGAVEGISGKAVRLHVDGQPDHRIEGTHLLIATGRTPNTDAIGLDLAGVEVTHRGHIKVDEHLRTTAPGVWAIGDCAGSPLFTHISLDDFRVIRDDFAGGSRVTTGRQVPFCLFTDPELARIGLAENDAKAQGTPYRLAKIPMMANLRTRTLSETRGFMKALVDVGTDRILGFTAFGAGAGEMMGAVQIAMIAGLPYTALRDAVLTHPTMLEGLIALFSTVPTSG